MWHPGERNNILVHGPRYKRGGDLFAKTNHLVPQGFLEYVNNVLAGGLISNLFTRDEQARTNKSD